METARNRRTGFLDSGTTCHMTPYISDFIPGSLMETDKYIKIEDDHFITEEKQEKIR